MANIFKRAKVRAPQYGWFDLSHENKLTLEIGKNTPVLNQHLFPGHRFVIGKEHLLRFMPMLAPVYQRFDVRFDTVFIPERIIWKNTKEFYRGGKDGSTDYPRPSVKLKHLVYFVYLSLDDNYLAVNFLESSLYDFMGLPTFEFLVTDDMTQPSDFLSALNDYFDDNAEVADTYVDLLPFLSYQAVYREYYRDQFVQENTEEDLTEDASYENYFPEVDADVFMDFLETFYDSDTDSYNLDGSFISAVSSLMTLRNVDWPKDYFTSAFPTPQLGNPVNIPVSSALTIGGTEVGYAERATVTTTSSVTAQVSRLQASSTNYTALKGDVNIVNTGTIQDLRRANRLQEYLEKSLLGGNRFIDWILAHFGVHSSDARLDRPELISRSKSAVTISDVTQTSADAYGDDSASSALGTLAGQGISVGGDKICDYSVEEPGWLQIYVSVVPKASYFQGIPKEMTKTDRFDYLIPEFAEIGEQPILKKELHISGGNDVFGYTERYAEYKFIPSSIHGNFRSSLAYWHDARMFASSPSLGDYFLQCSAKNSDLNRIFSFPGNYRDTTDNHLLLAIWFDIKAYMPLPEYPRYQL